MAEFEKSRWADSEFSQGFRDAADSFLPFRRLFMEVAKSLYGRFIVRNSEARVLDLGCGDGLFIQELSSLFKPSEVTLVDGSHEMLAAAQRRLSGRHGMRFVQSSFQQLLTNDPLRDGFDFIYSSLAIHHLPLAEKKKLYAYIYGHLAVGGWFVHYDVVLPPTMKLEEWYLASWGEWIQAHADEERRERLLGIPDEYKGNPDNMPDTLDSQLQTLADIGFGNVDCFYKCGIFALFGGSK